MTLDEVLFSILHTLCKGIVLLQFPLVLLELLHTRELNVQLACNDEKYKICSCRVSKKERGVDRRKEIEEGRGGREKGDESAERE